MYAIYAPVLHVSTSKDYEVILKQSLSNFHFQNNSVSFC